jgi:hypothetical protein
MGLDFGNVSPDGSLDLNSVKPRKTSRQSRRKTSAGGIQLFETQHEVDDGNAVKLEPADQVNTFGLTSDTFSLSSYHISLTCIAISNVSILRIASDI